MTGIATFEPPVRPASGHARRAIPALDGMRGLAALLVYLYHAWFQVPGYIQPGQLPQDFPIFWAKTGVQLFFVLSGFLLFLPYARWILGQDVRPSISTFYRRRMLRVVPAYWVSLLVLLPWIPITSDTVADVVAHALFIFNVNPEWLFSINGVYWTMAIEVQFYLLLPIIAAAMHNISRFTNQSIAISGVLILMCILSVLANVLEGAPLLSSVPVASAIIGGGSVFYWLIVFAAGMFCSLIYLKVGIRAERIIWISALASLAFSVALIVGLAIAFLPGSARIPFKSVIFGWCYALLLLGVLLGSNRLRAPFTWAPARFLGKVSYSFYIWHAVIYGIVFGWLPRSLSIEQIVVARFTIALLPTLAVAYVSYQLVERPFLLAGSRIVHDPSSVAPDPARERAIQA